jgi:hypothetical protein
MPDQSNEETSWDEGKLMFNYYCSYLVISFT